MAEVTVKLYGKFRINSNMSSVKLNTDTAGGIFDSLNAMLSPEVCPEPLKFRDAVVFVNGARCSFKRKKLHDGDVIWVLSPTVGG